MKSRIISLKSFKIWGIVLLIAMALYLLPPNWIFNDTLLLNTVSRGLDKFFTAKGLDVEIDKITWRQWNRIEAEGIEIKTVDGDDVPFSLEKMVLKISFWSYLKNPKAPSGLPKQLWLVAPYIELERYEDNTFNLQRYFDFRDRGNRVMSMMIGIKGGRAIYKDYRFGSYELHEIDGLLDMRNRTDSTWKFNGAVSMQKNVSFNTEGHFDLNEKRYAGELALSDVALNELNFLLPKKKFDYELLSGVGDAKVSFGIKDKKFILKAVEAKLSKTAIRLDMLPNPIEISGARFSIKDKKMTIDSGDIQYEQARLNAEGTWDTAADSLDFHIQTQRLPLGLLGTFFKPVKQRQLNGDADADVYLKGTSALPLLDGKVTLKQGSVSFAFADIEEITAQIRLVHNDILIDKAEGIAYNAPMSASGVIHDFFNPVYDVKFQLDQVALDSIKGKFDNLDDFESNAISLNGTISGEGKYPLFAMTAQTSQMSFRKWLLDKVKLDFAWNHYDQAIEINNLEATSYAGQVNGNGKVLFADDKISWDLFGSLDNLDVSQLSYNDLRGEKGTASINAVVRGEWIKGEKLDLGTIFGVFKGKNFTYQNLSADTLQAVFTWDSKKFLVDSIQFNIGQGRVYGSLIYDEKGIHSYLSAENVRFKELLDKNDYPIDGIIGGNAFVFGQPNDLTIRARCRATQTTCFDKDFGDLSGELIYHDKLLSLTKADVNSIGGNFTVTGTMGFSNDSPLSMEIFGEKIQLEEFAEWFPGTEVFDISGFGRVDVKLTGNIINPQYVGKIKLSKFAVRDMVLETGTLDFSGDLKNLKINEFFVTSQQSYAKLSGNVSEETVDLNFTGVLAELDKLKIYHQGNLLTGKLNFTGTMSGAIAKPQLQASVNGEQITYGNFQDGVLKTNIQMLHPNLSLEQFTLTFDKTIFAGSGQVDLSKGNDLNLQMRLTSVDIEDLLNAAGLREIDAAGVLNGDLLITGPIQKPILTANGEISNGIFHEQPFQGSFFCTYFDRNLDLNALDIKHKNGTLRGQGRWRDGDGLRLQAEVANFPLETINAFSAVDYGFLGDVNGQIGLYWKNDEITGEYNMVCSSLGVRQERIGNLFARGDYSEQGISIKTGELHSNSGVLSFSGYIPWDRSFVEKLNLPVRDGLYRNINISGTCFNASSEVLNALAPQSFLMNKGILNGIIGITGTVDEPLLSCNITGSNLRADLPMLGMVLDDFNIQVEMTDNVMKINSATARVKKELLEVGGVVNFSKWLPQEVDLYFIGKDIAYKAPFFDGYVDLDVRMQGNWLAPLIQGKISVSDSRIFLPPVSSEEVFWNPTLDLNLSAGKNVRFYQKGIADVYIQGQATVQGKMSDLHPEGRFTTPKGTISLYGKNFMIQDGYASFASSQGIMPYLDISSNTRIPQYEIILNIKGLVGPNLKLSLSAQPHMTQNEIYTALNWPQYEGDGELRAEEVLGSNMNILTDSVLGGVFEGVRSSLHLDYLYLDANYFDEEYRINVGDHITDKLFLSYGRLLDEYQTEENWELNYSITPRLIFGSSYSDQEGSEWRLRYGFRF